MSYSHKASQARYKKEVFLQRPYGTNAEITNSYENMYSISLLSIAVSIFAWDGFPSYLPISKIENRLYSEGCVAITYDEGLERYVVLSVRFVYKWDMYGLPEEFEAVSFMGDAFYTLDKSNAVIIYDNVMYRSNFQNIEIHANNLMQIRKTMNSVLFCMRTPYILKGNAVSKFSIQNIFKKIQDFEPAIFLKKFRGKNKDNAVDIEALNLDVNNIERRLQVLRGELKEEFAEALRDLGVASYIDTKKERVVKDEVSASMGGAFAMRNPRLYPRLEACKQMKDILGLDVSVDYDSGLSTLVKDMESLIMGGEG